MQICEYCNRKRNDITERICFECRNSSHKINDNFTVQNDSKEIERICRYCTHYDIYEGWAAAFCNHPVNGQVIEYDETHPDTCDKWEVCDDIHKLDWAFRD